MHICYIIWQFKSPKAFLNMGGAERQLLKIVSVLIKESKHRITVISRKGKNDLSLEILSEKVVVNRISVTELPIISMLLFFLLAPLKVLQIHKQEGIHVIHHPLPDFFLISIHFLCRVIKISNIARIAANELDLYSFHGIWYGARVILRSFILKVNAIQTLNLMASQKAIGLKFPSENIFLVPNGVVVPLKERDYKFLSNRLLYVGAMRHFPRKMKLEQKNLKFLIKSFSKLSSRKRDLRLLMVGDGNYRPCLEKIVIKNEEVADKVSFFGYQTDINSFHRRSDIFINPSHFEGLPNAVMEAMASGVYVLASKIPEHRLLLGQQCKYGDMFDQNSEEDFIQKILDFYQDPTPFIQKAQRARSYIKNEYSIEETVSKLFIMYKNMIMSQENR